MLLDQGDEIIDRLQAGAFGAVAPASQVLGGVAGVLVVEGLESSRQRSARAVASCADGRISRWSWPCCLSERVAWFFSHSQRVCLSSGRVVTSVRRTVSMASLSLAARWKRSKVILALPEQSSWSRAALTWCSTIRQILVSCSRVIAATFAIAAAKVSTSASNNSVNPDPGRAHGTLTYRTPCSGQRTPGSRACSNALCWKKSRCRHDLSTQSCTGASPYAQSLAGQANHT